MKKSKFRRAITVFLVILGVLAVLFSCLSPLFFQRDERISASAATYTAKGSFTFDTAITSDPFGCSVNFTSNNISFNKIEVRLSNSDYQVIYTKASPSSSDMSLLVYNDGWISTAYRTIDFGDSALDITESLYLFLDNCAVAGADGQLSNVSSLIVEGTWKLNSTPNLSVGSISQDLTNVYILTANFDREALTKIAVSSAGIRYSINGSQTGDVYTTSWLNDKSRYIFFESPVTLSASFYTWFTSNATQLSTSLLYNRLTIQTGGAESVGAKVNTGGEIWGTISVTSDRQLYIPVFDGTLSIGFTVFCPDGYTLKSVIPTNCVVSNLNAQRGTFHLRLTYSRVSRIVIHLQKEEGGGNTSDSYLDGYNAGYNSGYNQGYSAGLAAGQNISWGNLNVVSLFLSPVNSFLATPIFGSFSIGTAFSVVLVVLLAAIFIKMFAGG